MGLNFYKRYPGDYMRDTADLTMVQHGAYTMLLDHYYSTGTPLNKSGIYRICRAFEDEERGAVDEVLERFFDCESGKYVNKRAEKELALAEERAERARENGRNGGRPRNPEKTHPVSQKEPRANPEHNPEHNPEKSLPETRNQKPLSRNQKPDTNGKTLAPKPSAKAPAKKKVNAKEPAASTVVWNAYAEAYGLRYAVDPIRNAKVNGQLAQFIQRVPQEEAPAIAAFFVSHNNSWYIQKGHPIGSLLADAEKLRTEWVNGRQITSAKARQDDSAQSNVDAVHGAIAKLRARDGR